VQKGREKHRYQHPVQEDVIITMSSAASPSNNGIPSSPLVDRSSALQQQQQRRRCVAAAPVMTPRPESSPGISKLWMSASPRGGIATPRRVLLYHSASSPTTSPSLSPSSPRQKQQLTKKRRRRILLTGLVGISTWMYVSIAYFALSQRYFLEGEKDDIGEKLHHLRPGPNVAQDLSFSFQPSRSGVTTILQGKHDSEPTLATLPVKQAQNTKQESPTTTAIPNPQPRIVHLDDSFAFPGREPHIPTQFLPSSKRATAIRSTMVSLLPPSRNQTEHDATAAEHGGGMGFQDILRGTNSTPSDDDEETATT
jgi:hypothetical protein